MLYQHLSQPCIDLDWSPDGVPCPLTAAIRHSLATPGALLHTRCQVCPRFLPPLVRSAPLFLPHCIFLSYRTTLPSEQPLSRAASCSAPDASTMNATGHKYDDSSERGRRL